MDIDLFSEMIRDLILDNDEVTLPGLGTFVSETMPSTFSDKGYTINPPYRRLAFRQRKGDGRLLIGRCSAVLGVDEGKAENILGEFISELREMLKTKKVVVFPGLGRLRATRENAFFFIADEDLDVYKYGFGLEPVSLKTHEETPEEVSAAVDELDRIVNTPEPEPVASAPAEQAPAAAVSQPAPVPAPVREPAGKRVRNPWKTAWIAVACAVAAVVFLMALFIVLSRVAPGFIDSLLYSPEELEIINHVS